MRPDIFFFRNDIKNSGGVRKSLKRVGKSISKQQNYDKRKID